MMKNSILFILFVFCLSVYSCISEPRRPVTYVVEGVQDITLMEDSVTTDLLLKSIDKIKEKVILSVTGLPQGVIQTFSTVEGTPTFSTQVTLKDISALPGLYPCQLICTGTETGEKTYDFNLQIKNKPVCGLLTPYTGTSDCGLDYTDSISAINYTDESYTHDILFNNFGGRGFTAHAVANCSNNTIEIPYQSINSTTALSGQGTFTGTGCSIYYTIVVNGVSTNCRFTMQRPH